MRKIATNCGRIILVDDEDYERLRMHKWHINSNGYPSRNVNYGKTSRPRMMHQFVMMVAGNESVDHINGDKLDCQKSNLRRCSQSENAKNRKGRSNTKSGFKGVSWHNQRERWKARIMVDYKEVHLGLFDCKEEAAKCYDEAALKYHGEFARLNFPKQGQNGHTNLY